MESFTEEEAVIRFDEIIDKVQYAPITITRTDAPAVVMISFEQYQEFEKLKQLCFSDEN